MQYGNNPVVAVHRFGSPNLFASEDPSQAAPGFRCGNSAKTPSNHPLSSPPSQNYLAKAHFPIAGRKRRADDADLEAEQANPVRDLSPNRKMACVRRSQSSQRANDMLEQIRAQMGVSWKPVPESLTQASSGWSRWVQNHYCVESATILLCNDAWKAYFVRVTASGLYPSEQYFLFRDSLIAARHVSSDLGAAIQKISHWGQIVADSSTNWTPFEDPSQLIYASDSRLASRPVVGATETMDVEMA